MFGPHRARTLVLKAEPHLVVEFLITRSRTETVYLRFFDFLLHSLSKIVIIDYAKEGNNMLQCHRCEVYYEDSEFMSLYDEGRKVVNCKTCQAKVKVKRSEGLTVIEYFKKSSPCTSCNKEAPFKAIFMDKVTHKNRNTELGSRASRGLTPKTVLNLITNELSYVCFECFNRINQVPEIKKDLETKKKQTVEKGTISELIGKAEFIKHDFEVYSPETDSYRADFIVYKDNVFSKIQSKTGKLKNGSIHFATRTSKRGKRNSQNYRTQVDYFSVYCPDTLKIYLVPTYSVGTAEGILRVDPLEKHTQSYVNWARDFEFKGVLPGKSEVLETSPGRA